MIERGACVSSQILLASEVYRGTNPSRRDPFSVSFDPIKLAYMQEDDSGLVRLLRHDLEVLQRRRHDFCRFKG